MLNKRRYKFQFHVRRIVPNTLILNFHQKTSDQKYL